MRSPPAARPAAPAPVAAGVSCLLHALAVVGLVAWLHDEPVPPPAAERSVALVFAPAPPEPASVLEQAPEPAPIPQIAAPPSAEPVAPSTDAAPPSPAEPSPPPPVAASGPPPVPRSPVAPPPAAPRRPARPPARLAAPAAEAPPTTPPPAVARLILPTPLASELAARPTYPDSARRRGQQGEVLLRVDVAADGRAVAVGVARSSGFTVLDDAAVTTVRNWSFRPATRDGLPVAASAEVPIRFRLEN